MSSKPNRDNIIKWDIRFLLLANYISQWSKDPSTKTGAVIVDQYRRIVSTGFNGFPQGIVDTSQRYENRNKKYSMILHADMNAILFAGRRLEGCTMYTMPFDPCDRCATAICQVGITRVVSVNPSKDIISRWMSSLLTARVMFLEKGVAQEWYSEDDVFPERLISKMGIDQQA